MKNPFTGIIALVKKNPVASVGAAAVVVIAALVMGRKSSTTETVVQAAPPSTEGEQDSTPDYSGLFSEITDSLESMDERINAYGLATTSALDSVAGQNQRAIETLSGRLASAIEDRTNAAAPVMPSTTVVPDKTSPIGPSTAESMFASQVAAAKQIKQLQDAWKAVPEGPKQQAQRDALNIQANTIGVSAGFGFGGDSGTTRLIPENVRIAAGG